MRRAFVCLAVAALAAGAALAKPAVLRQGAALRAQPSASAAALASLPEGALVDVKRRGPRWSLVAVEGRRGYVVTPLLQRAEVIPAPPEAGPGVEAPPYDSSTNPNCDLGYPYSGSAPYFTGLTELRHTGPLGFFLGYHIARPC